MGECVTLACGRIRANGLDSKLVYEVIGPKWAYLVQTLLEKLGIAEGDVVKTDFVTGLLLSMGLQRLAGQKWCMEQELPAVEIMAGLKFTKEEYRDYFKGFTMPTKIFHTRN